MDVLKTIPDDSIDSIVTDPPYELGFMGKKWDNTGIAYSVELWSECLRVLKPGGHLLSFGGSRTYHRMACAIEDAGFEIRDQIMWVYGSGFPKSLDVSKAIDKATGAERQIVRDEITDLFGTREELRQKPAYGIGANSGVFAGHAAGAMAKETLCATDEANTWQGWGTALKPAHEPIVMARKPLGEKTVAENVLRHGTGAINIDGCRVGNEKLGGGTMPDLRDVGAMSKAATGIDKLSFGQNPRPAIRKEQPSYTGRFPANFIHDGSDEVLALFPDTGESTGGRIGKKSMGNVTNVPAGQFTAGDPGYGDSGSAARFFYCAKAGKAERNAGLEAPPTVKGGSMTGAEYRPDRPTNHPIRQNFHPTVKPVALMRYLVRMVTPPHGTVLDPFTGSGTTGKAAILEGLTFIGIEQAAEYIPIAEGRMTHATQNLPDATLF